MRAADGVDGREVEDVETHSGDVGQPVLDIAKGAVLALLAGRARKHLVPGAVSGAHRLDQHLGLASVGDRRRAVGVPLHQLGQVGSQRCGRGSLALAQLARVCEQLRRVGLRRPRRGGLDNPRGHLQLWGDVLAGLDALGELAAPGLEAVDPGLEGEPVAAEFGDGELGPPAVVGQWHHRDLDPAGAGFMAVADGGGDGVVAVGEDVGLDRHLVAERPLGGKAPAVDLGRHGLDGDALAALNLRAWEDGGLGGRGPPLDRCASHG